MTFIHGHWHAWTASDGKGVLLSNESNKRLRHFDTFDQAVNWLYTFGCKDASRELAKMKDKHG